MLRGMVKIIYKKKKRMQLKRFSLYPTSLLFPDRKWDSDD